jgi:hypothetical protein
MLSRSWGPLLVIAALGLIIAACEGDDVDDETTFDDTLDVTVADDDDSIAEEPTSTPVMQAEPTESPIADPTPTPEAMPSPEPNDDDIDLESLLLTRNDLGEGYMRADSADGPPDEGETSEAAFCGYGDLPSIEVPSAESNYVGDNDFVFHHVAVYEHGVAENWFAGIHEVIAECEEWQVEAIEGTETWRIAPLTLPVVGDDTVAYRLEVSNDHPGMSGFEFAVVQSRYQGIVSSVGYSHWRSETLVEGVHTVGSLATDRIYAELDRGDPTPTMGETITLTNGTSFTLYEVSHGPTEANIEDAVVDVLIGIEICAGPGGAEMGREWVVQATAVDRGQVLWAGIETDNPWRPGDIEPNECVDGTVVRHLTTESTLEEVNYELPNSLTIRWRVAE